MPGKTIYKVEPRFKSMNKAEGHFWVPNAAITEHSLSRRLSELDKEKLMYQADYRYKQRLLQKELQNIRSYKPIEPIRPCLQRAQISTEPSSFSEMIERYKRKRTDQEYIQDLLRKRRDSLIKSIRTTQSRSPTLYRDDTYYTHKQNSYQSPTATILDDMNSALTVGIETERLELDSLRKTINATKRKSQESKKRQDITFPRGLTRNGSKRKLRDSHRSPKALKVHTMQMVDNPTTDLIEPSANSDQSLDLKRLGAESDGGRVMLSIEEGLSQSKNVAMAAVLPVSVACPATGAKGSVWNEESSLGLQREEEQITKGDIEKSNRRSSDPVFVRNRELYNSSIVDPCTSGEGSADCYKNEVRRRFSEGDKYRCKLIKDIVEDTDDADTCIPTSDKDKETTESSDVIWNDVRRCRYLRGYDPPDMKMPVEEINLFVFGRDENDILELRREKPIEF